MKRVTLWTHQRVGAVVVIAFSLFTAGCAGGSHPVGGAGTTKGASDGRTDADKRLEYVTCLREHGLKIPDPPAGSDGGTSVEGGAAVPLGSADKSEAAIKACADKAAPGQDTPITQADKDKALAFARCMRKNGVNMPDPVFNGGAREGIRVPAPGPEKEKFTAAIKVCGSPG